MLRMGDRFPDLTVEAARGGMLRLPDELLGSHGIIVFYRGRW